jgi:HEAT repeat protein
VTRPAGGRTRPTGSRHPRDRAADLAALARQGPATEAQRDDAVAAADDPDPRVRSAALGVLVRTGDDRAVRAWQACTTDGSAAVRRRAAELGSTLPGAQTVGERVVAMLTDVDVTVIEAAAWALGELGARAIEAGAVAALANVVLEHRDALAREAAVAALGALGDPAGRPAVLAACGDSVTVRRRAVLALAPFDGPDVDAALTRALDDKDWQVRQAAEDLAGA